MHVETDIYALIHLALLILDQIFFKIQPLLNANMCLPSLQIEKESIKCYLRGNP